MFDFILVDSFGFDGGLDFGKGICYKGLDYMMRHIGLFVHVAGIVFVKQSRRLLR
jgi:hypothetical protein